MLEGRSSQSRQAVRGTIKGTFRHHRWVECKTLFCSGEVDVVRDGMERRKNVVSCNKSSGLTINRSSTGSRGGDAISGDGRKGNAGAKHSFLLSFLCPSCVFACTLPFFAAIGASVDETNEHYIASRRIADQSGEGETSGCSCTHSEG